MDCPFPGMDPWLEHPQRWPDVHNRLIAALADDLAPKLAPRYVVRLEERVVRPDGDGIDSIGRPDLTVTAATGVAEALADYSVTGVAQPRVIEVEVPRLDQITETFLHVRRPGSPEVITVIEVLSPANKLPGQGRRDYVDKRQGVLDSAASLVEVDLLRAGTPMPLAGRVPPSDYRVLVSRASARPRAQLHAVDLHHRLPEVPIPLLAHEGEPLVDLNALLHDVYRRARYDLTIDYAQAPVPPLGGAQSTWARELVEHMRAAAAGQ